MNNLRSEIDEFGFTVLPKSIDRSQIENLLASLSKLKNSSAVKERRGAVFGVRNLMNLVPEVREFAESRVVKIIAEKLSDKNVKIVRAIFFDKTSAANWKVPAHQDLTISVKEKRETEGFSNWTIKAKIQHVQPPVGILENMLALRFHLDDADETNGALKVVPGSHKFGRLSSGEIKNLSEANGTQICSVKQGDCLAIRPLLIHSSSAGFVPKRRRVIHLEFSSDDLPNGLNWYGS